ncbi:polysaccharide biosynthesis tyrosine autokinase [Aestuariimicrobium ganziense]|uniref:polysaccharide biosynthesis tyrosine autokinase n=1 Tax=Aestuariimicrobium ganziense TaxID=2773677 RepID=UPI0019452377|nr:polysaccharide biosynthesis tyrosine autokinase [Aestuariimicrobium ganziense]
MKISRLLRSVRRNWLPALLIGAILGAITAVGAYFTTTPTYTATNTVLFEVAGQDEIPDPNVATNYATSLASTYAAMILTPLIMEPVAESVPDGDANALMAQVEVTAPRQNLVATISYTDADEGRATSVVTRTGEELKKVVDSYTAQVDGRPRIVVSKLSVNTLTTGGTQPSLIISLMKGFVIGLLAALAWLALKVLIDTVVHDVTDLRDSTDASVLAHVRSEDDYLTLARAVPFLDAGNPASLLFTSSTDGEGASGVALGTARAMAASAPGQVLLIDADLREGEVTQALGLSDRPGLSHYLSGQAGLDEVIVDSDGLQVIAAGQLPPNPAELLATSRVEDLLEQVRSRFTTVLAAGSALLTHSDSALLASRMGGTVTVVGLRKVRQTQLDEALALLDSAQAHQVGVVLTDPRVR